MTRASLNEARAEAAKRVALTIAGSDPSGGAGLQADLKTFQQLGVYGMAAVTLITVQNTVGVKRVEVLSPELVVEQIDAVLSDITPRAIKIGALGNARMVRAVAARVAQASCPVVVDPVLVSKHGHSLADDDVVDAYKSELLPHASIITPNRLEAERLTGITLSTQNDVDLAIQRLHAMGAAHVLIKFGHVASDSVHYFGPCPAIAQGEPVSEIRLSHLSSQNTHGSGCILSAAVAARLAHLSEARENAGSDKDAREAICWKSVVEFGIARVYEAILANTALGHGIHPAETRAMQWHPSI